MTWAYSGTRSEIPSFCYSVLIQFPIIISKTAAHIQHVFMNIFIFNSNMMDLHGCAIGIYRVSLNFVHFVPVQCCASWTLKKKRENLSFRYVTFEGMDIISEADWKGAGVGGGLDKSSEILTSKLYFIGRLYNYLRKTMYKSSSNWVPVQWFLTELCLLN